MDTLRVKPRGGARPSHAPSCRSILPAGSSALANVRAHAAGQPRATFGAAARRSSRPTPVGNALPVEAHVESYHPDAGVHLKAGTARTRGLRLVPLRALNIDAAV